LTQCSQPSIFLTSVIMLEIIKEIDIKPALVFGHSLGEYAALYASGMLNFEEAFTLACMRGRLMGISNASDPGAMVAVDGDEKVAQLLIDQVEGYAVCANFNSYRQTVISGEKSAIDQIEEFAGKDQIPVFPLNVSRAFHSRLVRDCIGPMQQHFGSVSFIQSRTPVLACVSREVFPLSTKTDCEMSEKDNGRCIDLLSRQIDHPVDFISQVNAAYESGVRRFVEVGPKGILTRQIEQILENKSLQTVSLNQPGKNTLEQIKDLTLKLQQPVTIMRRPMPARNQSSKKTKKKDPLLVINKKKSAIDQIIEIVSLVSGYKPSAIDKNAEFEKDLGIDTLKIFEILSRLRGDLLPQEIRNFRELTSVQKILMAAQENNFKESNQKGNSAKSNINWYKHKFVQTARLTQKGPATPYNDYGVDRMGEPCEGKAKQIILFRHLLPSMKAVAEVLLPELHKKIVELALRPDDSRPHHIHVMTCCRKEIFYDGGYFAIEAFLKIANKDITDVHFSYAHVDGSYIPDQLIQQIIYQTKPLPNTGKHIYQDGRVFQGRLFELDGLFAAKEMLPSLLTQEDVVLITGGARGIAAHIAKRLIRKTSCRFILIGRKKETEKWIKDLPGDRVSYLSADLTDPEKIRMLHLSEKGITLLIHAAGIELSQNLLKKQPEEFHRVLATKIISLDCILSCINPEKFRGVVQFSSISSYDGSNGQADYAAANALLNGTLKGNIPALSIGWPAWSDIGMASRGVIKEILETGGTIFISPDQGAEAFEKLLAGFLISPPDGTIRVAATGKLIRPYMTSGIKLELDENIDPLMHYLLSDPDRKIQTDISIDLTKVPSLKDHSFAGTIIVPGSLMLREMIQRVVTGKPFQRRIEFLDIEFLSPIAVKSKDRFALHLSRQNNFFLAEISEKGQTRPIVSLRDLKLQDTDLIGEKDAQLLVEMQKLSSLKSTPFGSHNVDMKNSEESWLKGDFAVLDQTKYNGSIIVSRVNFDLAHGENTIFNDTGRVPFLLESAFQTGCKWPTYKLDNDFLFMPKHADRCTIYYQRCKKAVTAKIYCRLLKANTDNKSIHVNIMVVNQDEVPLVVLKNFISSPSPIRDSLPVHSIPTSVPFQIKEVDLIVLPLQAACQYSDEYKDTIITKKEAAEIQALPSSKRQKEKQAGKLAVKTLLANREDTKEMFLDISFDRIEVSSATGPVHVDFIDPQLQDNSFFSISHSDEWVCAACSNTPVGVDIERIRSLSEKTALDICGEKLVSDIQSNLGAGKVSDDDYHFLKKALPILIFTQKEAVLKAAGIGIGQGLSEVQIDGIKIQSSVNAFYNGHKYEVISMFDRSHVLSVARLQHDKSVTASEVFISQQALPENTIKNEVPLSYQQEASLRHQETTFLKKKISYTLSLHIRFKGRLYLEKLEKALTAIVKRHDVLRMSFCSQNGMFTGSILGCSKLQIHQIPVVTERGDDPENILLSNMDQHSHIYFDISRGPLFRINLFQSNETDHTLQIIFHHGIMDCFSSLILGEEIVNVYKDILMGKSIPGGVSNNYVDFVKRERNQLTPQRLSVLEAYWSSVLEGFFPLQSPVLKDSSHKPAASGQDKHYLEYHFNSAKIRRIEQICRNENVTLFTGLLSILQSTLTKLTHQSQSAVYIPFSTKHPVLDKGVTGPFVRLLPIRAKIRDNETYRELLAAQRTAIFDAIEYSDIPPENLVKITRKEAGIENLPPYIICQLIHEPEKIESDLPLDVKTTVHDGINPFADIIFSFFYANGSIRWSTTFNPMLIDKDSVQNIRENFLSELERLLENPTECIHPNPVRNDVRESGVLSEKIRMNNKKGSPIEQTTPGDILNRDQVIDQVIAIWQYALKEKFDISKDDNFFELEGRSLQAVEIVSNYKDVFGVELPLSSFVDAPTPALQADLLLSQKWEGEWDTIVSLKPFGSKPPFFCVHPSDGNVLCFAELASVMDDDYPFYGIQATGLKGKQEPLRDVKDMARHYIHAMRKIQPHGPYHVGGWSAGGVIAFEIAQQLKFRGELVNLVMIDTFFPGQNLEQRTSRSGQAGRTTMKKSKKGIPFDRPADEDILAADELNRKILLGKDRSVLPEGYQQAATLRSIWAKASMNYTLKAYHGNISLILCKKHMKQISPLVRLKRKIALRFLGGSSKRIQRYLKWEQQSPLNWKTITSEGIKIYPVPGNHQSLLYKENCQQVAKSIKQSIEIAEANLNRTI